MNQSYDTFSYPEDALYEPVMECNIPPVPPRTNRFTPVHPRKNAPLPATPQGSELNYEELDEVQQPIAIPKLPRRSSPSFREVSQRSMSPIPNIPQRPPPRMPDTPVRKPLQVPDAQQRPPAPLPDMGQVPELNYEDLDDFDEWNRPPVPSSPPPIKSDYEDLNDLDHNIPIRSPPQFNKTHARPLSQTQFVIDVNFLKTARQNLRKTDVSLPSESPKSQPEVTVKQQLATPKSLASKKPHLPPKPFLSGLSNGKSSDLVDRVGGLNLDSSDEIQEYLSEEEYDIQEDYMDATDVKSIYYQPYYYEKFPKSLENKIFNEKTEDGMFIIRKSSGEIDSHPYTMLVFFKSRPFRLKIRYENSGYAIGEKKSDEQIFSSVIDMVEHYKTTNLMLIGAGEVKLKHLPERL